MTFCYSIFNETVTKRVRKKHAEPGEVLFLEGRPVKHIYHLIKGEVKLIVQPETHRQLVLYRVMEGEVFCIDHLVCPEYNYTAIAVTRSELEVVAVEHVIRDVREDSEVALRLIRCVSDRHYQLRVNFERLGIQSASRRVLHLLQTMAHHLGSTLIDVAGQLKGLADDLNLTHEAVYRALRELEEQGSIRREKGLIQLISGNEIPPPN